MATIPLAPAGTVEELQTESLPTTVNLGAIVIDPNPEIIVNVEDAEPTTNVDVVDVPDEINVEPQPQSQETIVFPGVTIVAAPLVALPDVDPTGLENNSLLLYNATTGMWKPSKKLEDHFINAGQF
jgi:hypothetical protein